jgi:uncharacterized protein
MKSDVGIAAVAIPRRLHPELVAALARWPVVTLLGPRQVGKTTLAHAVARDWPTRVVHLDLERPSHAARLRDAELYLEANAAALIVIHEAQRMPELYALLRALVDGDRRPGRFLLLGSSAPQLVRGISESLAGRVKGLELQPFTLDEVGASPENVRRLWSRGGYPESFLASDERASLEWRETFLRSFVERDLPLMGLTLPSRALGCDPVPALGVDPDSPHAEESYAVVGLSDDAARGVGAAFEQVAVFRVTATELAVLACREAWVVRRALP